MKCIASPQLIELFKQYHTDRCYKRSVEDVTRKFLEGTGRTAITGVHYTVLSLLLFQGMEAMLAGYGGASSYDDRFLSEAIGYQLALSPGAVFPLEPLPPRWQRYQPLVDRVYELQQADKGFADFIESLLKEFK